MREPSGGNKAAYSHNQRLCACTRAGQRGPAEGLRAQVSAASLMARWRDKRHRSLAPAIMCQALSGSPRRLDVSWRVKCRRPDGARPAANVSDPQRRARCSRTDGGRGGFVARQRCSPHWRMSGADFRRGCCCRHGGKTAGQGQHDKAPVESVGALSTGEGMALSDRSTGCLLNDVSQRRYGRALGRDDPASLPRGGLASERLEISSALRRSKMSLATSRCPLSSVCTEISTLPSLSLAS